MPAQHTVPNPDAPQRDLTVSVDDTVMRELIQQLLQRATIVSVDRQASHSPGGAGSFSDAAAATNAAVISAIAALDPAQLAPAYTRVEVSLGGRVFVFDCGADPAGAVPRAQRMGRVSFDDANVGFQALNSGIRTMAINLITGRRVPTACHHITDNVSTSARANADITAAILQNQQLLGRHIVVVASEGLSLAGTPAGHARDLHQQQITTLLHEMGIAEQQWKDLTAPHYAVRRFVAVFDTESRRVLLHPSKAVVKLLRDDTTHPITINPDMDDFGKGRMFSGHVSHTRTDNPKQYDWSRTFTRPAGYNPGRPTPIRTGLVVPNAREAKRLFVSTSFHLLCAADGNSLIFSLFVNGAASPSIQTPHEWAPLNTNHQHHQNRWLQIKESDVIIAEPGANHEIVIELMAYMHNVDSMAISGLLFRVEELSM